MLKFIVIFGLVFFQACVRMKMLNRGNKDNEDYGDNIKDRIDKMQKMAEAKFQDFKFSDCKKEEKCRICTYKEILEIKECERSGWIEVYTCQNMKGVMKSCSNPSFLPRLIYFCFFSWAALFGCFSYFKKYRKKLEEEGLKKLGNGR